MGYASDHNGTGGNAPPDQQGQGAPPSSHEPVWPPYDSNHHASIAARMRMMYEQQPGVAFTPSVDNSWRGLEATSNASLPVWLSDQTLGGNPFLQNGMDAYLLPHEFFPPAPSIW